MHLKSFTFLLLVSFFLSTVSAQITVSASVLPSIGDVDQRMEVNSVQGIEAEYGSGESNEMYRFDGLSGKEATFQSFIAPEQVDEKGYFPGADLARVSSNKLYQELLSKGKDGLRVLGAVSLNPVKPSETLKWEVNDTYYLMKTPMNYQDNFEQEVSIFSTVSSEFLPDSILNSLPIDVDSFKFKFNIKTQSSIDGYGKLYVNSYEPVDVLRQTYYEQVVPRIEARSQFFPWVDVTDLVLQIYPQIGTILQSDTLSAYRYYSNESGFPVLEAQTDLSGTVLQSINYNTDGLTTAIPFFKPQSNGFDISVSPNPSDGKVVLKMEVKQPGDYKVRILNIIGYQLWSEEYFIYDTRTEKLDLSNLRRGTYFYSLVSPDGKTLVTKRLLIVGA